MDVHKIDTSAMHAAHASAAYHLLQDIPRPIALNAVVPQLFACPGYGFVNVLLEVASEAAQSIEADAIPQVIMPPLLVVLRLTPTFKVCAIPARRPWFRHRLHPCHGAYLKAQTSCESESKQILAECARASTRGAAPPFRSASNANRILVCAMQLGCGQYLMHALSPLFASIIVGNGVGGGDITSITTFSPPSASGRAGGVDGAAVVAALDEVCSAGRCLCCGCQCARPCSRPIRC
jgi:hypothetical protein